MAEYKEGTGGAKKLILLLVILCLLTGAFFGVRAWNERQEAEEKGTLILSFDPKDVAAFRYTLDGASCSFIRDAKGSWQYEQDPSLQMDQDAVNAMLESASEVYAETIVSENLDNLADYGLESPSFTLDLTLNDGEKGLYEGSQNSMSGVTYACMKGDGRIVALSTSLSGSFRTANDLLANTGDLSE